MRSTAGLLESFSVIPTYWLPCPGKRNALVVIFTAEMEKLLVSSRENALDCMFDHTMIHTMSCRERVRYRRAHKNTRTRDLIAAIKMARYDEDLHENLFFNTLVSKYNILFSEATEKKWMVSECIALLLWRLGRLTVIT